MRIAPASGESASVAATWLKRPAAASACTDEPDLKAGVLETLVKLLGAAARAAIANGHRKTDLQQFADETGLQIQVCHSLRGPASENKIERQPSSCTRMTSTASGTTSSSHKLSFDAS